MLLTRIPSRIAVPGRGARDRRRAPPVGARVRPASSTGDEQYYVFDAAAYLGGGIGQPDRRASSPCRIADEAHVGTPTARQVDHRPARDRPDRAALDRMAPPVGGVRDRGGGAALPPRAPPLALGVVGGVRGAPAGARRPPHRPEPDGDARHLPHDVRHRGDALPGARSRADGSGPIVRPMAPDRSSLRFAVPTVGRRLPRVRGRHEMVGRCSLCRSSPASARSGRSRATGAAIAPSPATICDARDLVRARSPGGLPAELRRVLLPARIRRPRLRDAADPPCCSTRRRTSPSSRRTRCRGHGRSSCTRSGTST